MAPLISKPFLLPQNNVTEEIWNGTVVTNTFRIDYEADEIKIGATYGIDACMLLLAAGIELSLYLVFGSTDQHPSRTVLEQRDSKTRIVRPNIRKVVVAMASMFFFVMFGLQIGLGSLLASYAVKSDLHLSKQTGADLTFLFWASFSFSRILAIFYVELVGCEKAIYTNLLIMLASNAFLAPFGNSIEWCLWVGIGVLGLGISSTYASVLAYFEEKCFPVTSGIIATFTICCCTGEFVFPSVIGRFIELWPPTFCWTVTFGTVTCSILFIIITFIVRRFLFSPLPMKQQRKISLPIEFISGAK